MAQDTSQDLKRQVSITRRAACFHVSGNLRAGTAIRVESSLSDTAGSDLVCCKVFSVTVCVANLAQSVTGDLANPNPRHDRRKWNSQAWS